MDIVEDQPIENLKDSGESSKTFTYSKDGSIVYLKFKPNTLYAFPMKKFASYNDVTYLSLPNNHLKHLDENIFFNFPLLTWLDVRENRLQAFPRVTGHKWLEQILIGGNRIDKLPIEIGSFESLYALQVTGNPLVFPDLRILENSNYDLVEFLKLCWQHQTTNPLLKPKVDNKVTAKKKLNPVKKEDCTGPVKQYRNVANVVAEKMKSSDPIDQIMANNVVKKIRAIEMDLKRKNDKNALRDWRERYPLKRGIDGTSNGLNRSVPTPYGIDPEFMSMMTRRELIIPPDLAVHKKKIFKKKKKPVNINEELKKLDMELDNLKNRKSSLDPAVEKVQRMVDIQKMNNIQKKIKELQIVNMKSIK